MTVDEWRQLERSSHDVKHEYIDGQVFAMAGGSLAHASVGLNTCTILSDRLGDGPCRVYNSDAAARLSPSRYTYPDATVTCDEHDQPATDLMEIRVPRVVVEVLSDTTEAYDRGRKSAYYRTCPNVEEYVLVATEYQAVEVYRRTAGGWATYRAYGPGDDVELIRIGVRFPVDALYRRTGVPATLDAPEGEL